MADADLAVKVNQTSSLIEQLGKALVELEAQKDAAEDKVFLKEISEHFRDLEARMMKKYSEIEVRKKTFKEEESDARSSLAERETAVAAKEQEMFDRIQELKDVAVAAVAEARANHLPASMEPTDVGDSKESKVSSSLGDTNALLTDSKETSPHKTDENNGGVAGEVTPRPELIQFCEQMDTSGLLNFVMENPKNLVLICEELSLALESATEPGRLVLDSLEGFYPPDDTTQEGNNKTDVAALQGMRQSCVKFLEAMATLLAKADPGADHLLNPEIKQQAKAIADKWKPKLAGAGISSDAANGNSLEAKAFLQLLATFRIASEFDEEELCKLVLAVAQQRQAPELCRSLGLTHKIPGIVEVLINTGKQISAVHFVHAFELTENFPSVPLLKTYLKDLRRNSQGKGGNSGNSDGGQNDANAQELAALKAVIECVQSYKLEEDYPLDTLQRRVAQLEKSKPDRKRFGGDSGKHQQNKKTRANGGGFYGYRAAAAPPITAARQAVPIYAERAYSGISERYPHASMNSAYGYQVPSQTSAYAQQGYDERSYYYPPEDRAAPAYNSAAPPTYGSYASSGVQSSYQPYM